MFLVNHQDKRCSKFSRYHSDGTPVKEGSEGAALAKPAAQGGERRVRVSVCVQGSAAERCDLSDKRRNEGRKKATQRMANWQQRLSLNLSLHAEGLNWQAE